MNYLLQIHPEASREFYAAIDWYEDQATGLGVRFEQEILAALRHIAASPESAGFIKGQFQQIAVHGFPFVIVYKIAAGRQSVFVSSIFHTSRNPKKKFRR